MTRWFAFHITREGALRKENYTNSGTWPQMVRIYCRSLGDFLNHPGSEPKNFLLVGWQSSTPAKGKSPNFFPGRLPHGVPPCAWVIFPWKVPFLENEFSFWNDLGSCSKSWFLVHVSIWLIGWWSKPVLSTLRVGNRASLLHPYINLPVFWGRNFKLKIIDWAWLFVAFVRFVYIS